MQLLTKLGAYFETPLTKLGGSGPCLLDALGNCLQCKSRLTLDGYGVNIMVHGICMHAWCPQNWLAVVWDQLAYMVSISLTSKDQEATFQESRIKPASLCSHVIIETMLFID